ncbi:Myophilin [Thelohanellus kitauei]|uniref:Transgelin n=1 Tax=Thelohanellus kitauei TaxID=669202 RepID=A0A0C2MGE1_THEKT|nr:Myophilin [Thelohanellus kitauei]
MKSSSQAYGLTKDVLEKIEAKYSEESERECMQWIEDITGIKFYTTPGQAAVQEKLKSGVILCHLINKLKPNSVKKINETTLAFKQMENISNFLSACQQYGLQSTDIFQTIDLFEGKNMVQVLTTIVALGRRAQGLNFKGPVLGPKEAQKNEREFTEEQLREGEKIIGLQMGSNKGATQSGQNFGKTRSILQE